MNSAFPVGFKPMLAAPSADEDLSQIQYPVYASQKLDGIRCLVGQDHLPYSRKLKLIPNLAINKEIRRLSWAGLDGELMVGNNFQQVTSGIMSENGEPDWTFYVFDVWDCPGDSYLMRMNHLRELQRTWDARQQARIKWLLPRKCDNEAELLAYNQENLALGLEGTMIRSGHGPYKYNRSTFREGYLVKIKPFKDDEATVVGFEEQMANHNEATTDHLGHTKRSSHKANLIGKGTLGALVVTHPKWGQFNIGTGFDDALRREIWTNWQQYHGKLVKFRYQEMGTKDKPRIPTFLGLRDPRDT